VIPRFRASCCSGSKSSASGPEDRRRVFLDRAGEWVEDVRRRWVFGFGGLDVLTVGAGVSPIVESSCFEEKSTDLRAILWDWLSWARDRNVSVLFTRKRRHSWICRLEYGSGIGEGNLRIGQP
jgi:hypothetical protein